MTKHYKIKKGLDIKLHGEAEKVVSNISVKQIAVKPTDYLGVTPKLLVKEGAQIKAGDIVFSDKKREYLRFTSPVSGIVKEIVRGEKRVIQEIIIEQDEVQEFVDFGKSSINDLSKEQIVEKMLKSGVWNFIRQRPYNIIANPEDTPKAIFISAFDSAPLAPDFDLEIGLNQDVFQRGIDVLSKLTTGKIHLNIHEFRNRKSLYENIKGVQLNCFSGPHPSGNIGIQIHHIEPINKGDIVWHINVLDILSLAKLFIEGHYTHKKLIALTGSEIKRPRYYRVNAGTSVSELLVNNLKRDNVRVISGNVLSGEKISKKGFLGAYHNHITVIPEGNHYSFLGWILPGFKKFSVSKTYTAWLLPNRKYNLHTNINGGQRPFVMTGIYEKYFPMDIMPMQLSKAILAKNLDMMENLGIYEINPEDVALCEVVCPSKIEMQEIIAQGLEFIQKEMS
ncbi:MAG: NADH:ubiquinone reductase (Na(+)-transporting) subunit A [Bacteroidetes bacterium HGW-Bacteroidetes-15]|nr:MAG: NADH:ubiquinone reductase (Na(+)-transporting) subunit A [Bacteroidetes bacterium HGW-Bacteroidetes-15]